jgi:hypothetical protein
MPGMIFFAAVAIREWTSRWLKPATQGFAISHWRRKLIAELVYPIDALGSALAEARGAIRTPRRRDLACHLPDAINHSLTMIQAGCRID